MNKLKRTLALALVLCMMCSFFPVSAFADESTIGHMATKPANGATTDNPFPVNAGDSKSFRIPALVTLSDGTMVAAADARWNSTYDNGGIDTLVSVSTDGGANWNYSYANYMGDNGNSYNNSSTCYIDPSLTVVKRDNTEVIYMLVDLYPYGVAIAGSAAHQAETAVTGFDSQGRLLLSNDNHASYGYYLSGGKIYAQNSTTPESEYTVDEYFNLYINNTYSSNLFFADSAFKVQRTGYLHLTKGTYDSATKTISWSAPELLNLKTTSEMSCLVGPGRGLVTSKGAIVFPVYSYNGESNKYTGLVYSEDNGATWKRTAKLDTSYTSEAAVLELGSGNLRIFARNENSKLTYFDYALNNGSLHNGTWGNEQITNVACNSDTELSAITYSKRVEDNGVLKDVVLVSAPAGPNSAGSNDNNGAYRSSGKIFMGLIDPSNYSMTWKNGRIDVTNVATGHMGDPDYTAEEGFFAYSCLTEQADHSISVLYENNQFGWGSAADGSKYYTMDFKTYTMDQLQNTFGVTFGSNADNGNEGNTPSHEKDVTVKVGQTFTEKVENIYVESGNKENDYVTVSWTGTEATATKGIRRSDNEKINLTDCLFTFTDHETEGYYVVESSAFAGRYLNNTMPDSSTVDPISATPGKISLTLMHTDMFRLQSNNVEGSNYGSPFYAGLHFHTEASDPYWDRCGNDTTAQCCEYLYRAAKADETSSTEIPGYIRLKSLNDVQSGGEYLIAHTNGTNYYVLYPGASQWECVVKVDPTTNTAPASTTVTITGKAAGQTTVELGNGAIVYNVTVEKADAVVVQVKVNETKSFTISGSNLENSIVQRPAETIADMTVTGVDDGHSVGEEVTTLSEGKYLIFNTRASKLVNNTPTQNNNGRLLDGTTESFDAATAVWTITPATGGYTIQDANGKYMKITNGNCTLEDSEQVLTVVYANGTWTLMQNNAYLNQHGGGSSTRAAGWQDGSASTDTGSQFRFYPYTSTPASTTVTFTGKAMGNTTAVVGDTTYNITVIPANTVDVMLAVDESKTYNDTTGNYQNYAGNVQPDTSIADMTVTGTDAVTAAKTMTEITSTDGLVAGKQYIIVNERRDAYNQNHGLLTTKTYTETISWSSLKITGLNIAEAVSADTTYVWTITPNDDGTFAIMHGDKYLTLDYNSGSNTSTAGLTDTPTYLKIEKNNNDYCWFIRNSENEYLSNIGRGSGYTGASGFNEDGGSHWKIFEISDPSTPASTQITFTGVATGTTTAVVGNTLYNILVTPVGITDVVEIELEVGESFTYTDTTGNHAGEVAQQPNETYATMAVSGTSNSTVRKLVPVTESTFQTGKRYIIQNVRASNPSHAAYQPGHSVLTSTAATGGATGLVMDGPLNQDTSQTWTFTPTANMYYVGRDNTYITLNGSNAYMSTTAQSLSFEYVDGSGWLIYYNQDGNNTSDDGDYFLSDVYGTGSGEAFGYTDKDDDGNYWNIYEVVDEPQLDATRVTFTGKAEGQTYATVGSTLYNITVVPVEVDDEVMNSATDVWTVDPEVQRQRYNTIINDRFKDEYSDESWRQYEAARQAAYKKLVEVSNAKYDSEEKAAAALAELKARVDALEAAAARLVAATIISVSYKLDNQLLDIREYKVLSTDNTLALPETIVVDNTIYRVTNPTLALDRNSEGNLNTSYDAAVTLVGAMGGGFVASEDVNAGSHEGKAQICDLVDKDDSGNITSRKKITEMTLSTGISYDLDLGTDTTGKTVTWTSANDGIATVDANGNVTAVDAGTTMITATITDANGNKEINTIPVTVFPKGSGDRKTAIYIDNIDNTTVWCVLNADTEDHSFEVIEGELIYGQFDVEQPSGLHTTAISFFGDPDEAHALVYMKSTNSLDQYYLLHDDDGNLYDGTVTPNGDYFVSGTTGGAGYWHAVGLDNNNDSNDVNWQPIKDMAQWAINLGCDGAFGFTRRREYPDTEGDLASNLSFASDPLPRVAKQVDGVLPTSRKQSDYRRYAENMVAGVHELVYFKITVTLEAPTRWRPYVAGKDQYYVTENGVQYACDENRNKYSAISYHDDNHPEYQAIVSDTVLPGAYLYTKERDQADGTWDGEVAVSERSQTEVITTKLDAAWTEDELEAGKRVLDYFLVYEIQESDIPKFYIDNVANLDYYYKSHYSRGSQAAAADAEARITLVGSSIDSVVIDFGQSVTYQSHRYTSEDGKLAYTFDGLTDEHLKGAYYGENSKATATYGDVQVDRTESGEYIVTYTPTSILQGSDAIQIFGRGDNNQEKVINGFLVYPATSVYYEEGFILDNNTGWTIHTDDEDAENPSQTFELLGVSQFDQDNKLVGKVTNKKHAYGYDPIYDGDTENGEVVKSWLSSSTVGHSTEFTFTGTGFELFANCTMSSSYITAEILNANDQTVRFLMVNTVVKPGSTDATIGQGDTMDALPIISIKDLEHGTYTVRLTKVMADGEDVFIDGVRIFNTISDSSIYTVDLEDNPKFYQMRDAVLNAIGIMNGDSGDYDEETGHTNLSGMTKQVYNALFNNQDGEAPAAVITSRTTPYGDSSTIQDMLDKGPKNEIYLWPDQTLSFNVQTQRIMQIGLKTPRNGTNAVISVRTNDLMPTVESIDISAKTDMFYYVTHQPVGDINNVYQVSITNDGTDVLSITDLKICDDPNAALVPLTEDDVRQILIDAGYTDDSSEPEVPDAPLPFVDVPEDAYFHDAVAWAVKNKITSGVSETHFGPDATCTRAQAVTFLWCAAGKPAPAVSSNPFEDVQAGSYYEQAVLWAVGEGITTGTDTTHFSPDKDCTRAQIVTFLYHAFDDPAVSSTEIPFSDVPADVWYTAPILWAAENGITSGVGDGLFGVNNTCSRAQIVTFLYKAYN